MWTAILKIVTGIWLMIAPALFQFEKMAANTCYIIGPLVLSFAIIALWELNHPIRYLDMILGLGLLIAPFMLKFDTPGSMMTAACGLLLIGLSLIKRKTKRKYGGGWHSLFKKNITDYEG